MDEIRYNPGDIVTEFCAKTTFWQWLTRREVKFSKLLFECQSAMTTIQPGEIGTIEGMTIRNNGTTAAKIMVTDKRYIIVTP